MAERTTPTRVTSTPRKSSGISRAQFKRDLHAHYHSQLHRFFTARQKARGGGGRTKTKNGFGLIVPPSKWYDAPINKVLHDSSRPPYTRVELRAMHHGVYKW